MPSQSSHTVDQYPPLERCPHHVGIIMDGNGRWARARGLPRLAGHRAGTENLRRILRSAHDFGIKILTLYAFSTENWGRSREEVRGLMSILNQVLNNELAELHESGVRIRHIGRRDLIPARLLRKIDHAVALTRENQGLFLNVALNYGGRAELVDAVRQIVAEGVPADQIDEDVIVAHLYTAGLPDPDLIIRTSGEMRVSNFLIWQGAYAEYYVTPLYWPDFGKEELYKALAVYSQRDRRFGKVSEPSSS